MALVYFLKVSFRNANPHALTAKEDMDIVMLLNQFWDFDSCSLKLFPSQKKKKNAPGVFLCFDV